LKSNTKLISVLHTNAKVAIFKEVMKKAVGLKKLNKLPERKRKDCQGGETTSAD
jgi:hypothetical protein